MTDAAQILGIVGVALVVIGFAWGVLNGIETDAANVSIFGWHPFGGHTSHKLIPLTGDYYVKPMDALMLAGGILAIFAAHSGYHSHALYALGLLGIVGAVAGVAIGWDGW